MYHIKREAQFGDAKLNEVNCRKLVDQNEVIINNIREIFIGMNKSTISEELINMSCDKYKQILTKWIMHIVA